MLIPALMQCACHLGDCQVLKPNLCRLMAAQRSHYQAGVIQIELFASMCHRSDLQNQIWVMFMHVALNVIHI